MPPTNAVVVSGVSGVGKSTVAAGVARLAEWPFIEGDDLHSAQNIAKLTAGMALTDDDRLPWLTRIRQRIDDATRAGGGVVIACSALTRRHREVLCKSHAALRFAQLSAPIEQVRQRIASRHGHFMGSQLLESQFATIEPLTTDEPGEIFDARLPLEQLVAQIVTQLIGDQPKAASSAFN